MRWLLVSLMLFAGLSAPARNKQTYNPRDYGLFEAKSGLERFEALMRCHTDAVRNNGRISYEGIEKIELEIPFKAQSIPLPEETDFASVRIYAYNHDRNYVLFLMTNEVKEVDVDGESIDDGNFKANPMLVRGTKLLIVEDQNLWVKERIGYKSNGYKRKDILVVKNGRAINNTVQPYNNANSAPNGWYCDVSKGKKVIKNLDFYRTENSTVKTYPIAVRYQYNVELSNISITTPQNTEIVDDCGIMIYDCAKVVLNDARINGTYSKENKSGSGVRLINVYDVSINRMYAKCEWGVFGNYYVNRAVLRDCDINRFDIHCYGRDIKSINCKYTQLYNQFSSIFGQIEFQGCEFVDFIPILIESSYNAYTPFELSWKNCTFHLTKKRNYLMTLFGVPEPINPREELREKCIPNISIRNCSVQLDDDVNEWFMVKTHGLKYKGEMDYLSLIDVQGLTVSGGSNATLKIFSEKVPLKRELMVKTKKINTKFEEF